MKKHSLFAATIFALFALISCTRTADSLSTSNTLSSTDLNGSWRVTLFSERGNDETTDFNGYTFAFESNGTLTASRNGIVQAGTWSITDNSRKFNIALGPKTDANKPLGELTDDWKIITTSATEIKLTDDNAASSEFLTFSKN